MKEKILQLQKENKSYREIEKITGLNRGTISYYCSSETRETKRLQRLQKREDKKKQCTAYKGGKCISCGFNRFQSALEFHHLDPKTKDQSIANSFARNHSFKRIKKELDKCILLCANCHRGIHSGELVLDGISRVSVSSS